MLTTIIIILLVILCIVELYVIINLRHKVIILEKEINSHDDKVLTIYNNINNTLNIMKKIDYNAAFEKDDEVGIVFQQIKDTILLLVNSFTFIKTSEKTMEKNGQKT